MTPIVQLSYTPSSSPGRSARAIACSDEITAFLFAPHEVPSRPPERGSCHTWRERQVRHPAEVESLLVAQSAELDMQVHKAFLERLQGTVISRA
jgi:hypothetical protein